MGTVSMAMAYIWSAVILVIFFVVAMVLAHAVKRDETHTGAGARRFWFWLFAVLTLALSFLINLWISHGMEPPHERQLYINNSIVGAGAAFVLYVAIGFLLSKAFKKSKIGTWF